MSRKDGSGQLMTLHLFGHPFSPTRWRSRAMKRRRVRRLGCAVTA
jgi:hypothetical protein